MLNPLTYTEKVVRSFLRYQLTAYPFADERLNAQMRRLLSLEQTRATPLMKGPYVSLSRAFQTGVSIDRLVAEKVLHEHMRQVIPFPALYGHQEEAIRAVHERRPTLISTGTGSGKSECFLYPVISRCLELRDSGAAAGLCAVIVYPMNALAEDQLGRLRELLAGSGITFGMYVGKTPDKEADVTGVRLPKGSSRADYRKELEDVRKVGAGVAVHPPEEICSRETMRTAGHQPRILLTNVKQLELLLTRHVDVELFDNALLDFLVFDEAHTFSGAQGAETACLIRRLRSFCGRDLGQTACVATSATIVDPANPEAARAFASRFFGVPPDSVVAVRETYEAHSWAATRTIPAPPASAGASLEEVRHAVDVEDGGVALRTSWQRFTGRTLPDGDWEQVLFEDLTANELLYQASELLTVPLALADLVGLLSNGIGRVVSEEEIITWLILGASARKDGRPLIRPVVHAFVRGVPGAVVMFDGSSNVPILLFSAESDESGDEKRLRLPVSTCTTCGQHYFELALADFSYTGVAPGGGKVSGDEVYWEPLDVAHGGIRMLLTDHLISQDEEEEDEEEAHPRLTTLHLCRTCGTAHKKPGVRCLACGQQGDRIPLQAVQQKEDRVGYLPNCVCCGAHGRSYAGRFREPAKPVRAVNVADIHVLAQDMVHHADRKRLLVFADNRQDAAFQAGWMRDHARRFRLRALMAREIAPDPISVGDLVHQLDAVMEADEGLSLALLPEVWQVEPDQTTKAHRDERRYFLRIQVLLELTMASTERIGLEPWGRIKISYRPLNESAAFFQTWARRLRIPADELLGGVEALLDQIRRKKLFYDSLVGIFSKFWAEGAKELQNGFLPELRGVPKGFKLSRASDDDKTRVEQWLSSGHQTTVSQIAGKWGVEAEDTQAFLKELWVHLAEVGLLVPVTLKGSKGNALPRCTGVHQVNGDCIVIAANASGVYRCRTCRRRTVRRTPHMKCLAWRCGGVLEYVPENLDNYDLQLVDEDYTLLRPREHTAMVPGPEREKLENIFKGDSDVINALVCTQTLELGVDIGALDAVLMRNVPPLPANYWQRVGRAGRRHRMAVNLTYARLVSHDRAYFAEPLKMLTGHVTPPCFNLSNELMVAKHVHAAVITTLHQLARASSPLTQADRTEVANALKTAFPAFVRGYLFDDSGDIRPTPLDVTVLHTVITKQQVPLERAVASAFTQGWPEEDAGVVASAKLAEHVLGMTGELEKAIRRLHRRLMWAMGQMQQLDQTRHVKGSLDEDQEAFFDRCRRYVAKLKGKRSRRRREAEGVDDTNTYGVLAAEGFLPGYGLEVGSVIGLAEVPKWVRGMSDFELPRPASIAIREYVPGNLIYANGQRFVPRHFARQVEEGQREIILVEVNTKRQSIREMIGPVTGDASAQVIRSMPVCDVTLVHQSRISDEEENRFQLGVFIFGREMGQHNGGKAFRWGPRTLHLRKSVRLQLVNVGAPSVLANRGRLGYPVCTVCGQSVSPFSSDRQRDEFLKNHTEWCGVKPEAVGFHAELAADALFLPDCTDRVEAFTVMEGLRFAAAELLNMDTEDLQVMVIGHPDRDECDALLYDPMPGGSGLLDQLCAHFPAVVQLAQKMADECPGLCASSCIDCFQTYRNAAYHKYLDRHILSARLSAWGSVLDFDHDIPGRQPAAKATADEQPVGEAERKLRNMIGAAGFPEGRWQIQRRLPQPLGTTTPDVTYDDASDEDHKVFIYLDGLSAHIHGNPSTHQRDLQIRNELRSQGHDVIEITAHDLDDQQAMVRHFKRLARLLIGRDAVDRVTQEAGTWFQARATIVATPHAPATPMPFVLVEPRNEDMWATCVPVYDLKVAAGAFGEGQAPTATGWAQIQTRRGINRTMFVAQVVGKSMEPRIPDGGWCLFTRDVAGSRDGRVLAIQHQSISDPDTGGQYTIKEYRRPPQDASSLDGLSGDVLLTPANPAYTPIRITAQQAGEIVVIGELLQVLG